MTVKFCRLVSNLNFSEESQQPLALLALGLHKTKYYHSFERCSCVCDHFSSDSIPMYPRKQIMKCALLPALALLPSFLINVHST